MQQRRKCPTCGLPIRLAMLPDVGYKWVHRPGDRVRHDRAVYYRELEAWNQLRREHTAIWYHANFT